MRGKMESLEVFKGKQTLLKRRKFSAVLATWDYPQAGKHMFSTKELSVKLKN